MHTTRRSFLKISAAAGLLAGWTALARPGRAGEKIAPEEEKAAAGRKKLVLPADVKITAITSTHHTVRHPRKIGRNSFGDHEGAFEEPLVRVRTSAGVEGIGNTMDEAALGKSLGDLLEVRDDRLRLRGDARELISTSSESVLLDIVGKIVGRPAAELLGPEARRQVPCYDGSIYMRDLDGGDEVIRKDISNGLEAGHRAFKIKIGRGHWLKDRALGHARDLAIVRLARGMEGGRLTILVDANNYYNLEESLRLVDETAEVKLWWLEEMFSEERRNFDDYRRLRARIKEKKLETLLADGETGRGDGDLLDLLKEGTIQVSQPDIRTLGLFAFLEYAELIRPFGAAVAPHAWAKQVGVLEICLLGKVVPNFAMVEDCRLTSDVLRLPGLRIRDGQMTVGAAPGMGLEIDEAAYRKQCEPRARTVRAG